MAHYFSKSLFLLVILVVIVCGIYPATLWVVGQTLFPFQANGSIILDANRNPIGSKLIAQPFTKDEYFQPRPSAASYNAAASTSSALAASNYALRDRVARSIATVATDTNGKAVGPDVEKWFRQDKFQGKPYIVEQWATLHTSLAQAWVSADPKNAALVDDWAKKHPDLVKNAKGADLAVPFFRDFSHNNLGKFPLASGSDIQAIFFDMWRQEHPDVKLQNVPGDLVTTSASGLDPHITLQNAMFQLDRVANARAKQINRKPEDVHNEIRQILLQHAEMPLAGLAGEQFVNVLEINLILQQKYSA